MYLLVLIHIVLSAPVPHVDNMQILSFHQNEQACLQVHAAKMQEIGKSMPDGVNLGCVALNGTLS